MIIFPKPQSFFRVQVCKDRNNVIYKRRARNMFIHSSKMAPIVGSYTHEKSEGFGEYFSAIGLPERAKKAVANTKPSVDISKEGDEFTITIKTENKTNTIKFVLGNEFEEQAPFGNGTQKEIRRL